MKYIIYLIAFLLSACTASSTQHRTIIELEGEKSLEINMKEFSHVYQEMLKSLYL